MFKAENMLIIPVCKMHTKYLINKLKWFPQYYN